jgi:pimeloyl-ACP methyl ester carboxylesterase
MVRRPLAQQHPTDGFLSSSSGRGRMPSMALACEWERQRTRSGDAASVQLFFGSPTATLCGSQRGSVSARDRRCHLLIMVCVALGFLQIRPCHGQSAPAGDSQRESARTSDGVDLAIWYYPAAGEESLATVMLIHDTGGSHRSVEPLALDLQALGISVVAPDLRGHGDSTTRTWPNGKTDTLEAEKLRKPDFDLIVASQGGRVREQARLRGDLETVFRWIQKQSETDKKLAPSRLCLVGSGTAGIFVTVWAAADAAWPQTTSGPQGGNVRAICLISPAYANKGANIGPALQTQSVSRELPIIILAAENDRDAARVFEQLKRTRSDEWFEKKPDDSSSKASEVNDPATDASLFLLAYRTRDSADALVTAGSKTFAPLLADFLSKQLQP